MKVICAWCCEEVKPALLWEKAPLSDPGETYSICVHHRLQVKAQIPLIVSRLRDRPVQSHAAAYRRRDVTAVQRLFTALTQVVARG